MKPKFNTVPLDTMIDKHIGKRGTVKRDAFENELRIDLIGQTIKSLPKRVKKSGIPKRDST